MLAQPSRSQFSIERQVQMATPKVLTILLVEDDEGHAMLVQMNLRYAGINNPIKHIDNGREALEYVKRLQTQDQASPLVVLLDINLPEIDGYTVLAQLKSEPKTRKVPVVVLTSTDDPNEINRCYELGCNIFLRKPVDYPSFTNAIRQLGMFLAVVEIPDTE